MDYTQLSGILTIAFAILASISWFYSATVRAPHKDKIDKNGWTEAAIISDGNDVIERLRKQSFWSAVAAGLAGLSAIFQAINFYCNY